MTDSLPTPEHHDATALLGGMPSPERVRQLEQHLLGLPQVDLQTGHLVHGGMYARTIMVPAGTMLTGALTNQDNVCVVHGDITVTTDTGTRHLVGFNVLPACAGSKRAGIAHADTWWTTLWTTDLTDITEIENVLTDEADQLQTRRQALGSDSRPALEN